MKMYTTPEQTTKLIELGFERPKIAAPALKWVNGEPTFEPQYTIGELIEFLPKSLRYTDEDWSLSIESDPFLTNLTWWVYYATSCQTKASELIDALFDMVVKLKEEGVI